MMEKNTYHGGYIFRTSSWGSQRSQFGPSTSQDRVYRAGSLSPCLLPDHKKSIFFLGGDRAGDSVIFPPIFPGDPKLYPKPPKRQSPSLVYSLRPRDWGYLGVLNSVTVHRHVQTMIDPENMVRPSSTPNFLVVS